MLLVDIPTVLLVELLDVDMVLFVEQELLLVDMVDNVLHEADDWLLVLRPTVLVDAELRLLRLLRELVLSVLCELELELLVLEVDELLLVREMAL